ncbi:MAG: S41 family peptidase [Acidobacteriota bacterium]|nr:S41 family peptidase [Acidobacteriota bacterium]
MKRRLLLLGLVSCLLPIYAETPVAQQVENLRAFVKLYGYVRWFHPGDEAADIDWEAMAVHGAAQVVQAPDDAALKKALEAVFMPVAPTLVIFEEGREPAKPDLTGGNDIANLKPVAWQHFGVGLSNQGSIYESGRTNRGRMVGNPTALFGNVMQGVEAKPLRGARIKFEAQVRARVSGAGNQAQLWFRVDNATRTGFFDNMGDRPIVEDTWKTYSIEGEVADDAEGVVFGAFLKGKGAMWVDNFRLWAKHGDGPWEPVELKNPSFEDSDSEASGWRTLMKGYEHQVQKGEAPDGKILFKAVSAEKTVMEPLFEEMPEPGELMVKDLSRGLRCRFPLMLYSLEGKTLGGEARGLDALKEALKKAEVRASAENLSVRLAAVTISWNVFQHFYPYFDVVETDWDQALTDTLKAALPPQDTAAFRDVLRKMVAGLHDGHGNVFHLKGRSNLARPPVTLVWLENKPVVWRSNHDDFQKGDVLLSIDGKDARTLTDEQFRLLSGSPRWRRHSAVNSLLRGPRDTTITVRIKRGNEEVTVKTLLNSRKRTVVEGDSIRMLEEGVHYVDLSRADMEEIKLKLEQLAEARGVVFDLRGYPNGNHAILQHLTDQNIHSAWWRIPRVIRPDQDPSRTFTERHWDLPPLKPRFKGKIVFLTFGGAISYAESVMGIVEHYKMGEIIGSPTAGANGNVNPFSVPGDYRLYWTGMRVEKQDRSRHHLVGILPTIPMEPTISGLRAGRDELLEKAVEVINETTD